MKNIIINLIFAILGIIGIAMSYKTNNLLITSISGLVLGYCGTTLLLEITEYHEKR